MDYVKPYRRRNRRVRHDAKRQFVSARQITDRVGALDQAGIRCARTDFAFRARFFVVLVRSGLVRLHAVAVGHIGVGYSRNCVCRRCCQRNTRSNRDA